MVLALIPAAAGAEKIFNDDWMRANGYGDIVGAPAALLAEQYLNGAPSDEELGTDSITGYQRIIPTSALANRTCSAFEYGTIPKGTQYHVR